MYFDLALPNHRDCGFFRASVRLVRSLLEHPKLSRWSVDELVVPYVQKDHQLTSCLSALFHACGHLEKVCSSSLCASDVQCSQEFYIPSQHIRDLNCCAAKSWLLCLISPTPCSFHHCTHQGPLWKTCFAGDSDNEQTFSKLKKVIQVPWKSPKEKDFYILNNGSFNRNRLSLRSNVWDRLGHKCCWLPPSQNMAGTKLQTSKVSNF